MRYKITYILLLLICSTQVAATDNKYYSFVQFISHCESLQDTVAANQRITNMLDSVAAFSTREYGNVCDMAERVLDNPNSSLRDESMYITFLRHQVGCDSCDMASRLRATDRLQSAMLNRPGMLSSDVMMMDIDGHELMLHDIPADRLLLYINDADCHACGEMVAQIQLLLGDMIAQKQLIVVSLSVTPSEAVWRSHIDNFPREWIVALDRWHEVSGGELYDIRALPTIYLLDAAKRVILKDASLQQVVDAFRQ